MADTIQIRRDTSANWTSVNPILAQGEIGLETDTNKRKTGKGSTAWNSLTYDAPVTDQKTGVSVTFTNDSVHGTIASPETGNITASYTGAKLCATVLIIHDNTTEPTYPATWQKISGTYSTSVTNYISAIYLDSTHVKYSIYQDA